MARENPSPVIIITSSNGKLGKYVQLVVGGVGGWGWGVRGSHKAVQNVMGL